MDMRRLPGRDDLVLQSRNEEDGAVHVLDLNGKRRKNEWFELQMTSNGARVYTWPHGELTIYLNSREIGSDAVFSEVSKRETQILNHSNVNLF